MWSSSSSRPTSTVDSTAAAPWTASNTWSPPDSRASRTTGCGSGWGPRLTPSGYEEQDSIEQPTRTRAHSGRLRANRSRPGCSS